MIRITFIVISLFTLSQIIFGQTVLSAGDIAITGVNMDSTDAISIVFLLDIESGTVINFTDNGWKVDNTWRTGEGIHVWTAATAYSAGDEIVITLVGPSLAEAGDQVIAYQNISDMVAAINDEGTNVWQADATSTNTSALPQGLSNGTNCVALTETDNIMYNRSITTGTQAEILAAINDYTNWSGSNSVYQTLSTAGYTVTPSPLISVSPTSLSSFVYLRGSGPSAEQSFTVSGSNLTADISLVPPTNYEISTGTGGSFVAVNPITLSQSGGSVAVTTIYTRLKAGLSIGSYNYENIVSSSTGSITKNVVCSGNVLPNLVINEILADPDATNGDANGDDSVDTDDDEFVEIINNELTTQDFGGYTLSDALSIRHTFPSPTNIPAGESIVVFGGGTPTNINGTSQIANEGGTLSLNNSGDDVILKSGSNVISSYTYGAEGGDNQSLGRNPDITGDFAKHSTFAPSATLFSPGKRNDNASPLPVELTSFTAKLKRDRVILKWATATEVNNYGFSVEKKNNLVTEWEEIGFVEGHGNSNSPKAYSYVDASLINGKVSYRLKQIDTDGNFEYSDIITITNEIAKTKLFQNHPNPFNPSTEISFALAEAAKVNVSVYNVLGEKVAELVNQNMNEGVHNVELNGNNLTSGFYFYRLETSTYVKTMKMVLLR